MIHQISTATSYDRYPEIFKECQLYFSNRVPKILSFGCSKGLEVKTLTEKYFLDSKIDGVDINKEMILSCKELGLSDKVSFYNHDEFVPDKYELIFCMSVLCRWPQTADLEDCSEEYPFSKFSDKLVEIDRYLNPGGLLVIYNSNFMFTDTELSKRYSIHQSTTESGFVTKFTKDNKHLNQQYPHSIFIKN
jgi:hypothetical protein